MARQSASSSGRLSKVVSGVESPRRLSFSNLSSGHSNSPSQTRQVLTLDWPHRNDGRPAPFAGGRATGPNGTRISAREASFFCAFCAFLWPTHVGPLGATAPTLRGLAPWREIGRPSLRGPPRHSRLDRFFPGFPILEKCGRDVRAPAAIRPRRSPALPFAGKPASYVRRGGLPFVLLALLSRRILV